MSETKRNRKKTDYAIGFYVKTPTGNRFTFFDNFNIKSTKNNNKQMKYRGGFTMTNFQKPPVSLKQKKFAQPTLRQSSQLGKRDRNTYATFLLSITILCTP